MSIAQLTALVLHERTERLLDWAPPHGVRQVVGEILAENVAMIDLARHLGFQLRHLPEDRQIIEARLSLAPPPRSLANDPIVG